MDSEKIQIFMEVMQLGSFAKAARALDMDPSVVSRTIALLEQELSVRLFHRTTRKLTATDEGRTFFQNVKPLTEEFSRLKSLLKDRQDGPTGTLRITSPVSFGLLAINPLLPKFHALYPDIQIEYLITDSVLNLLDERIDVAVRFGHLNDSSFISQSLTNLDYILCASSSYLKHHSPIKKPTDVGQHNCLQFLLPGFNLGWRFRSKKTMLIEEVMVSGHLRASNALALKDAALFGSGIALLPKVLIARELKAGKLIPILEQYDVTATEFDAKCWAIYPSKDFLPNKTRLFLDFLRKEVGRP